MTKYPPIKELLQFMGVPKVRIIISISVAHVIHFVLKHHFG